MAKTPFSYAGIALCAMLGLAAVPVAALAHTNPVDKVSNPEAHNFSDVGIHPRDMAAPFVRDGVVTDAPRFATIQAGLPQNEVQNLLGEPVTKQNKVWDYHFKFMMPQSSNYIVCQYKVRFDAEALVRDATWRRRQCQNLAAAPAATN